MIKLSGSSISTFQWSNSEQVWPLEKADDGSTLFCKLIEMGLLPNNGIKSVAHGLTLVSGGTKMFSIRGIAYYTEAATQEEPMPNNGAGDDFYIWIDETNVNVKCPGNRSQYNGKIKLIYAK